MFNPSTAPRWKIVMSTFRRVFAAASTVRVRNEGAKPRLTIAMPPFRMNTRREIMTTLTSFEILARQWRAHAHALDQDRRERQARDRLPTRRRNLYGLRVRRRSPKRRQSRHNPSAAAHHITAFPTAGARGSGLG